MSKRLGKFEGCSNQTLGEELQAITLESGHDDELGEVEAFGWYGLILNHKGKAYIVNEDSQGFFTYTEYDNASLANEDWQRLLIDYSEFHAESDEEEEQGPDIADDDIRLDHIPDVAECRQIRKQMDKNQFWPNVWHINERGNTDLLVVGYNGAKIVKSWV